MAANWLANYDDTVLDPRLIDDNFGYLLDEQLPLNFSDSSPNVLDFSTLDGDTPSPLYNSQENSPTPDWPFDSQIVKSSSGSTDTMSSSKRTRAENRPDSHTACWESPLCPSNGKGNGSGPLNCTGECAPFLFAKQPSLENLKEKAASSIELELAANMKTPTQPSHTRKRVESALSSRSITRPAPRTKPSTEQIKTKSSPKDDQDSIPANIEPEKPAGRIPHHQVERKYRENVNSQLEALRKAVPVSTWHPHGIGGVDIEDFSSNARQPSKATILSSATAYIKQLEQENKQLQRNAEAMENRNKDAQSSKCDDCSLMKYVMKLNIQASN